MDNSLAVQITVIILVGCATSSLNMFLMSSECYWFKRLYQYNSVLSEPRNHAPEKSDDHLFVSHIWFILQDTDFDPDELEFL